MEKIGIGLKVDLARMRLLIWFLVGMLPLNLLASEEIKLVNVSTGVGVGCYGQCGFLQLSVCVKNLGYEKDVRMVYVTSGSDKFQQIRLTYQRSNGTCDIFGYRNNFGTKGQNVQYMLRYQVNDQVFVDDNEGQYYGFQL